MAALMASLYLLNGIFLRAQTAADAASRAQQIGAEAVRQLRSGHAGEAKQQLDRALALAPADAGLLTWRGIAENQLADYTAAAADFRSALALHEDLLFARYNLALSLIRLRQTDDAILELRKVVVAQPDAPEPAYNLGVLLEGKGLLAEAAMAFTKAHALRPEDAGITLHLLVMQLASGRNLDVAPLIREIASATNSPELQQRAGEALLQAGRPTEAVTVLEAARRQGGSASQSTLLLVRALMSAGRASDAMALEQQLYQNDPSLARALELARVLLANDHAEQAVTLLRGVPDGTAAGTEKDVLLGIGLASTHEVPGAIVHLQRAISADAAQPLAQSVLGFCFFTLGEYTKAAAAYARASDLQPERTLFARHAAVAYERANKADDGLRYAERANTLDAGSSEDHVLLGKFLLSAGRDREAIEQLQKAAALNPDLDAADYLLARTYARLGQRQEAASWASKLAELKQRHEAAFLAQKKAGATAADVRSSRLLEGGGALDGKQTETEQ